MKKTKIINQKGLFTNPLYRNSTVLKAVKKLEMTVNMKQSKSRKNLNLNKNLSDTSPSQVENDNDELEKMAQENIDIIEKHRKEIKKRDAQDNVQVHKIRITVGDLNLHLIIIISCFIIINIRFEN